MEARENTRDLVNLVLRGIAVAMGVAVVVLNILHAATPETQSILLGMGLLSLAIASIQKEG